MPTLTPAPHVNPADETIHLGPLTIHFLLTADQSAGTLAAFEVAVPARERLAAPAHSHDHYEETIYALEGTLTWTVNGTPIPLAPGQSLCIPRGAVHRFDNLSPLNARALCLITPAAIGPQYFRDIRAVLAASTPPNPAQLVAVMRRHGLTPAGQ